MGYDQVSTQGTLLPNYIFAILAVILAGFYCWKIHWKIFCIQLGLGITILFKITL